MAPTDAAPRATESQATEQVPEASAGPSSEDERVAEGLTVKIGYVLAGIAAIGLCVGAVVAVIGDESHVTTGGTIAAISAGLLAATLVVGLLVVFHHKRTTPAEATEPEEARAHSRNNGKARPSRPASAKRSVPRTTARS
jgi:hypothetical protein